MYPALEVQIADPVFHSWGGCFPYTHSYILHSKVSVRLHLGCRGGATLKDTVERPLAVAGMAVKLL